jgi:RNA polymerase sigma-70 factor (ECF subfamily)
MASDEVPPSGNDGATRATFERLLGELRPKLHRYCARMTGSVIDGEDVVQDALIKALEAFDRHDVASPQAWLFRIAHNAALDHLRRRARQEAITTDEDPDMIVDPKTIASMTPAEDRLAAATSLHTFMRLPVAQRSSIILMDVLGYSLEEIGDVTTQSIPAVKAALHRGRTRLHELAQEPDDRPAPRLAEGERALLAAYVDRFNARDFDAVRDMLSEEVRLDLVNRRQLKGREVANYFGNYAHVTDWRLARGFVDRRPAILVYDPADPARPQYFILLQWARNRLATIRDFRYAPYALDGAEVIALD